MKYFSFIKEHIAEICMCFGVFGGFLTWSLWLLGYLLNGFCGYHFDLQSCWTGLNALGVGGVGLMKWLVDSKWNSKDGIAPSSALPSKEMDKTNV